MKDVDTCVQLGKAMHAEGAFRNLDYSADKCRAIGRLALAKHPTLFAWVVVDKGDKIIGMMIATVHEFYFGYDKIASDLLLYVDKTRRGGVGAVMLIQRYVDWAIAQGCKEIQLGETTGINAEAVDKLYRKCGFVPVGTLYKRRVM